MALAPGTFLGPYEITGPAGAGGMGEVYRARDTRLDRQVAIKVLPSHLSGDAALRARLEREARAISQLNHPNICTLHDVGNDGGVTFLVMEYLEGETLAARTARGPLPLPAALRVAMPVAEALDRAHGSGIVHRDLKPSNIFLVRAPGASSPPLVKLLDFGLAKAAASPLAVGESAPTAALLTGEGAILGTLQYMAPEQLEGREVDARADIFAFGAVLYEMLTGQPAFRGASQASLIASILTRDPPPVSTAIAGMPPFVDHVIAGAVAKDPAERWASMHDVLLQLRWIAEHPSVAAAATAAPPAARRGRLWWRTAALALLLAIAAALALIARRTDAPGAVVHFEVPPPPGTSFLSAGFGVSYMAAVVSHDGSRIILPAIGADGVRRLWLRRTDAAEPQPLARTGGGFLPFWSPDDRSIAFFADGKLMRLDLPDGTPRVLCDAPLGFGGTWSRDGVIVFAPAADAPLHRVSAAGGQVVPMTSLDAARGQVSHRFPGFLPDGRHVLYLARSSQPEQSALLIGSLDSAATETVMATQQAGVFVPPHWLAFARGGMGSGPLGGELFVQRFDPDRRRPSGDATPLVQGVIADEAGKGGYSFSGQGTLAYRTQGVRAATLQWYSRAGRLESIVGEPGDFTVPRLSPDGRRVAVAVAGSIWIRDLARGTVLRMVGTAHCCPVWSPDGSRVAFRRGQDLAIRVISGTGGETVVLANGATNTPTQWTPDGRAILFQTTGPNRVDALLLPLAEPRTPRPVLQSPFNDEQAQVSPDGRWIAYTSDEAGRPDVYVQDYPGLASRTLISTSGGADPQWRADGRELFFLGTDQRLMAVAVTPGATFEAGIPVPLFQTSVTGLTDVRTHYQPTADGQRFLVNAVGSGDRGSPTQVVVNWPARLPQ